MAWSKDSVEGSEELVTPARLSFGALRLDRERYSVELDGNSLGLTRVEFDLLDTLAQRAGRVVQYAELASRVLQTRFLPESTTLRVHLTHLRRKLGRAGAAVVTVRGRGLLLDPQQIDGAGVALTSADAESPSGELFPCSWSSELTSWSGLSPSCSRGSR